MRRLGFLVAAALLLSVSARPAAAQLFGGLGSAVPGEDAVSIGIVFGQMSPQTTFRDGGGFDSSTLIGATVSFWVLKNLGFQLSASGTKHEGLPATDGRSSIVSGRDPRIWTTMIDMVGRLPFGGDGPLSISPYVAVGGGWKTYRWQFDPRGGPDARGFDLAWSWATGLDLRFGPQRRLGLRAEYRDVRTPLERWGEKLTHQDRVLTGALLLHF